MTAADKSAVLGEEHVTVCMHLRRKSADSIKASLQGGSGCLVDISFRTEIWYSQEMLLGIRRSNL